MVNTAAPLQELASLGAPGLVGRLRARAQLASSFGLALFLCACSGGEFEQPTNKGPSPNASIKPAPLIHSQGISKRVLLAAPLDGGAPRGDAGAIGVAQQDAGVLVAKALRSDQSLPQDIVGSREHSGYSIQAEWKWGLPDKAPSVSQVNPEQLSLLQGQSRLLMRLLLSSHGRMQLRFDSVGFPVPQYTELRSQLEYLGHTLVWPNQSAYRSVAPGGMRALFGERRVDVLPLISAKITEMDRRGQRFGLETQYVSLRTSFGQLTLEQAKLSQADWSGVLLCRYLVELVAADPASRVCAPGKLPVSARFDWEPSGSIQFELLELERRTDLLGEEFSMPPRGALVKPGELPPDTEPALFPREALTAMRRSAGETAAMEEEAPNEGLLVVNYRDGLRYLILDGVPVAWVQAGQQRHIVGPLAGQYTVSWRDFWGMDMMPPTKRSVPSKVLLGSPPEVAEEESNEF